MKKFRVFSVVAAVMIGFVTLGYAMKMHPVAGEVTKMEGEFVEVKDTEGKTHKLHTNETTKKVGEIVVGAKVTFEEMGGHANIISVVTADTGKEMKGEMKKGMEEAAAPEHTMEEKAE